MLTTIEAADIVRHRPTGETWTVACVDPLGTQVMPCGWPETLARSEDCTLLEKAPEAQRRDMLAAAAGITGRGAGSLRSRYAAQNLAAMDADAVTR